MSTDSSSDGSDEANNFRVHLTSALMDLDHLVIVPKATSDRNRNGNDSEASDLVSSSSGDAESPPVALSASTSSPPAGEVDSSSSGQATTFSDSTKSATRYHQSQQRDQKPTKSSDNNGALHSRDKKPQQQEGDATPSPLQLRKKHSNTTVDSGHGKQSASETDDDQSVWTDDDQSGWTISEDSMLRGMKNESTNIVSWADIAKALRRTKNDVRARWRLIKDNNARDAEASSTDRSPSAEPAKPMSATSCASSGHEHHDDDQDEGDDQDDFDDIYGNDSEDDEQSAQRRYLYRDIYGCLYPPNLDLAPDGILSKEDCAILATIDSQYERNRLLEMQANFLNAAGREIPISYLREKLRRAQESREEQPEEQKTSAKVRKWIDQVQER
ncbi:hypothetical protein E4U21_001614 [Claviceps maximensis]|nr:hypothetical protein E4U21_001614 [Claviceps maximensis]